MKKTGIGIKIICACVLLLLVVYAGGCYYYGNHFQRGTLIDQVDVSNLTVQDLADRVDAYFLRIQERKSDGSSYEESIDGKAIDLSYASTEPLQQILREQNQYLWFIPQREEHETEALLSYNILHRHPRTHISVSIPRWLDFLLWQRHREMNWIRQRHWK